MAAESVTPVNEHSFHDNAMDMNVMNSNYDDDCRVEDVAFSVSIRDSQSRDIHIDEGCSIRMNDQPNNAENRSLIGGGDRPETPRSPGMHRETLHPMRHLTQMRLTTTKLGLVMHQQIRHHKYRGIIMHNQPQ